MGNNIENEYQKIIHEKSNNILFHKTNIYSETSSLKIGKKKKIVFYILNNSLYYIVSKMIQI